MAVTVTTRHAGKDMFVFDVEATADGDAGSGSVAHGLGAIPLIVLITPLLAAARTSNWILGTLSDTAVEITKTTATGSGATGNQVRCVVMRPHSIGM